MSHPMLRYPDGPAGGALLLLRISASVVSFEALDVLGSNDGWPRLVVSGGIALLLAAGIATRTAAALVALLLIAGLVTTSEDLLFRLAAACATASLAALGPGAYSVDAKRFGRRVIRVESRPPNRGAGE